VKAGPVTDAEASAGRTQRRLLAASESGNHSFCILDAVRNPAGEVVDFRFAYINAVGARLLFDTADNLVGKLYSQRMPLGETRGTFAIYKQVVDTAAPQQAELHILTPDLDATWLHIHASKLEDGVAVTTTDISQLKQTADTLAAKNLLIEESEQRLAEIQKLARLGDWDYDFSTDTFRWSPEVCRMFEMQPGHPRLSVTEITQRIHPEDRERLLKVTLQIMAGDSPESVYARILRPGGGVRYLQARAQCHVDDAGKIQRISGTVIDVTEKIELHDALRASDARFENFMENSPALTFIKDRDGNMVYMNRSCMEVWGLDPETSIGKNDAELWSPELAVQFRELDRMVIDNDMPDSLVEIIPLPGGGTCCLLTSKFPLRIPGKETLIGGVSIDITEQKEAENRAIQALAERDVLLKEVHHRVKNNLQVICSLLGMQAAVTTDPRTVSALRVSQDRVQSMAMIHELLYGTKMAKDLDFSDYAGRLMSELFSSYGIPPSRVRAKVNVASIRLGADRAILCGLILNELISNSLKYAFPLLQQGEIVVTLESLDADSLRMIVADNGIGMPDGFVIESAHSLGLRVVQILVKQLEGTLSFASSGGTTFEMTFPASELSTVGSQLQS
jgi:PAS domain S-box-containing protein